MEQYTLEHSQYSADEGMYPWHIQTLAETIEANRLDFYCNNRKQNKWQVVFIGSLVACQEQAAFFEKWKPGALC